MLPLNYAILDYHSIKRCFHYNGSAGISFLLQQCIALDDFSEGHSDYYTFGRLNLRTIGLSDYRAFGQLGLWTIGPTPGQYIIGISVIITQSV